jgi:hypothetical protein
MGRQRNAAKTAVERWDFQTAVDMAKELPHLFAPISDLPQLTTDEREALARCKAAVETLKLAFFAAGKALQIIRDGRLYRATHDTFEAFVWDEFGMKRAYANKLIRTWRLAEYLIASSRLAPNWSQRKLNQGQLWELVEYAETWDVEKAAHIYITVYEADEVPVTAAVLQGAVAALQPLADGEWDKDAVQSAIIDYLASLDGDQDDDEPADFTARVEKAVPYRWVQRLAKKDTSAAGRYLDELQAHIDKCRAELLTTPSVPEQKSAPSGEGTTPEAEAEESVAA